MAKVKHWNDINTTLKNKCIFEEDISKALKSFLMIGQIFCTVPASMHRELDPTQTLSQSRCSIISFLKIAHVLWCGAILVCVLVSNYFQYVEFDTVMPIIQKALYISEYISNALSVLVATVGCYWHRKLYRSYFDRIIGIDLKLQSFRATHSIMIIQRILRIYVVSVAVFFAFVLVVDFFYNEMSARAFFRSSTVYTIPNVVSLFSLAQYQLLIVMIRIRYNRMNHILERNGGARILNADRGMKPFHGRAENMFKKVMDPGLDETINMLRALHADLESLTSDVTASFGVLIMIVFVGSFLVLSIQIFALYKVLEGENFNVFLFCYTLLWIALHLGRMVLVLLANDAVIKEKSKTGGLLNAIDSISPECEILVNRFILQLMAQSRAPIVCGMIELNMMFLGTIVGALTTYVIFLIQFDLGSVTLSATTGNHSIVATNYTSGRM